MSRYCRVRGIITLDTIGLSLFVGAICAGCGGMLTSLLSSTISLLWPCLGEYPFGPNGILNGMIFMFIAGAMSGLFLGAVDT